MSRNQILVRNITHLTDARYFAAMGVDWMSIALNNDPTSFMRWNMLKDWVSGVKLAAELHIQDEMLLAKTMIEAKPDGLIFFQTEIIDDLPPIQLFFDIAYDDDLLLPECSIRIISYGSVLRDQLLKMDPQTTFVQAEWTIDQLEHLLETGYRGGICMTGGEEDVTGVRDYELMDSLLEKLL